MFPSKLPKAITDKYSFANQTFTLQAKDDVKDRLEVEVGDSKQPFFYPQLKLKRWDNEVNFSARLVSDKDPAENTSIEGKNIKWAVSDKEALFYDIDPCDDFPEGAYEFEIILKKKPKENFVKMSIQTKGLEFYYQPELTQEEKDMGATRPENVVGSYAVYYKDCPANIVGGKEYKTGKAFHIYRPRIEDSAGNWVWGELFIATQAGILSVTIPQEFLDSAVYPIRHAAGLTFGYTSVGASEGTSNTNNMRGNKPTYPSDISTIDSLSVYTKPLFSPDGYFKFLVIDYTTRAIVAVSQELHTTNSSYSWQTKAFDTPVAVTPNITGAIGFICNNYTPYYKYDYYVSGGFIDSTNSYTAPQNPDSTSGANAIISLYATYTSGGATSSIKKVSGVTQATVKKIAGLTNATTKSVAGVSNVS